MVDAKDIVTPPFTLYLLNAGEIAIRRAGSIMKLHTKQKKCDVIEDTVVERNRLASSATLQKPIYGIFGQINLLNGAYLILIEEASLIGQVIGSEILRVEKLLYLPLANPTIPATVDAADKKFIDMLETLQKNKSFYFSYSFDLTKRIQVALQELVTAPATEGADLVRSFPNSINYVHKFAFNHQMLQEFVAVQCAPFRVPVIYGFVSIQSIDAQTNFTLVSRKDARRMGRRFIVRGLDRDGCAANFCETEHIISHKKGNGFQIAAHLQIRGSIPLIWQMKPNMAWAPPVTVNPNFDESLQAAQKHCKETQADYQQQYFVNLIDKKGSQDRIGKKMTQIHKEVNDENIKYVWFDFHGECKKMKWENLSKLVDIVKQDMLGYGYFMAELDAGFGQRELINSQSCRISETQSGVMRTNCMDCLDRTNVVQGVFSRQIAHLQLAKMQLAGQPEGKPFEVFKFKGLEQCFRNAWTDNADILSLLYTGTPALKTDFTRTGKRSTMGAINDGKHSMIRYYINNFTDGYNNDCLDLSQGQITAKQNLNSRGFLSPLKIAFVGIISALIATRFLLNEYLPVLSDMPAGVEASEAEFAQLKMKGFHAMVYMGVFLVGMLGIQHNGRSFVDDASRLNL